MRRSISYLLLTILFAMLVVGAGARDDPALIYNSETVRLLFDDVYTPAGVTLSRIDCEVLNEAGVLVSTWNLMSGWSVVAPDIVLPIRSQASALPNGLYQIRVRVWDNFGNVSPWSTTMWANKMWRDIPAPGGCRTTS